MCVTLVLNIIMFAYIFFVYLYLLCLPISYLFIYIFLFLTRHLHMSVMEPNLPRPESALARGIKITEFSGSRVNPEPVTFEESDILLEEYLSPRRLVSCKLYIRMSLLHKEVKFKESNKVEPDILYLINIGVGHVVVVLYISC